MDRNGDAMSGAQTAFHRRATHQLPDVLAINPTSDKDNIMKTAILFASLLVSSAVYANDVDPNGFEKQHFVSSATRAEVVADLKAAQQQGLLPIGELGVKIIAEPSTKTRAQVAAEARQTMHVYGEQASVE
jgi:Domain of unknown function (DUF4148)